MLYSIPPPDIPLLFFRKEVKLDSQERLAANLVIGNIRVEVTVSYISRAQDLSRGWLGLERVGLAAIAPPPSPRILLFCF